MEYTKSNAEKLIENWSHLLKKPCYPYGKEGKEFILTKLELEIALMAEYMVFKRNNPNDVENHRFWKIRGTIKSKNEMDIINEAQIRKLFKKHLAP